LLDYKFKEPDGASPNARFRSLSKQFKVKSFSMKRGLGGWINCLLLTVLASVYTYRASFAQDAALLAPDADQPTNVQQDTTQPNAVITENAATPEVGESPAEPSIGTTQSVNEQGANEQSLAPLEMAAKYVRFFDAKLADANKILTAVLFYDFGTSRRTIFGAADIKKQPASQYLKSIDIADAATIDLVDQYFAIAMANYESENQTMPRDTAEAIESLAESGYELPPLPSGVAYAFDPESKSLLVEPKGLGIPAIALWSIVGSLFLTFRLRFINIRGLLHAFDLGLGAYFDPKAIGQISSVRALSTSLGPTLGMGAITGVAIAVGTAGLGAVFWVMLFAILSMATRFAECSLGQIYKTTSRDGSTLGGPMVYLDNGFRQRRWLDFPIGPLGNVLSILFALLCSLCALFAGNAFQVSQSLACLQTVPELEFLKAAPWMYGAAMAVAIASVVFGSVRMLGWVAYVLAPVMLLMYLSACGWVIASNWSEAGMAIRAIFTEAFNPNAAVVGGIMGVMVIGLTRAAVSMDTGLGTTAIVHTAAKCDEPSREGIIAMLEPVIVGVVLSLVTAVTLGVTSTTQDIDGQAIVVNGQGAALLIASIATQLPPWGLYLLQGAFFLFAFSACITWGYYGERCLVQLFGTYASIPYKLVFVCFTFLGSILTAANLMVFSHLLLLILAIPNMIALYFLHGIVLEELDDYWARLRGGKFKRKVKQFTSSPSE
jgi:alanine or glycine:cation symporter, AGCS family